MGRKRSFSCCELSFPLEKVQHMAKKTNLAPNLVDDLIQKSVRGDGSVPDQCKFGFGLKSCLMQVFIFETYIHLMHTLLWEK